jgi:Domain of unknown function (DUF4411)
MSKNQSIEWPTGRSLTPIAVLSLERVQLVRRPLPQAGRRPSQCSPHAILRTNHLALVSCGQPGEDNRTPSLLIQSHCPVSKRFPVLLPSVQRPAFRCRDSLSDEEVLEGRKEDDELLDWAKDDKHRSVLVLDEAPQPHLVGRVVAEGYADDLTDDQIDKLGRDPFLIAYAFGNNGRCIATTEVSKPKKQRHNRHVPDVCQSLKVLWCGPWELNQKLGFKTGWKV